MASVSQDTPRALLTRPSTFSIQTKGASVTAASHILPAAGHSQGQEMPVHCPSSNLLRDRWSRPSSKSASGAIFVPQGRIGVPYTYARARAPVPFPTLAAWSTRDD
ncbi:hypothetical protein LIA77_09827 [Sarocladium implicatum]|nr:hypothetical protein LIA77_09827 [Sarocladium implicatum]